jgi:ppGpp synthetase/RelA/SpoT-type nucleotidyltranferase
MNNKQYISSSDLFSNSKQDFFSSSNIHDVIALRVVIKAKYDDSNKYDEIIQKKESFLCYYIRNLLLSEWPAKDGKTKDYILSPKANGYQSLHHTSVLYRYGQEWSFEVQIRTEEMHKASEFGHAAHWDYKLNSILSTKQLPQSIVSSDDYAELICSEESFADESCSTSVSYLATIEQQQNTPLQSSTFKENSSETSHKDHLTIKPLSSSTRVESYIDALTSERERLLSSDLYVFFSPSSSALDGKILMIPTGSSVSDALKEVCKDCGFDWKFCFNSDELNIFLNGRRARLVDTLSNGDVLTVPTELGDRITQEYFVS